MPRLSVRKRKELEAPARRPDEDIDLSDIPEIRAIPPDHMVGRFYQPRKTSVTIRLDADVVARLRASGKALQARINNYLPQLMRQTRAR
jgi:uncharacterized protein (DUF4415 family)